MKKITLLLAAVFCITAYCNSQVINNSQIIQSSHWIYDCFNTLSLESKHANFTANTPVTAGELKLYFKGYDREKLSENGKALYDKAEKFLYTQKNLFPGKIFQTGVGIKIAPELNYKSNESIDWTYNYYRYNNPLSMQLDVGLADYFSMGGDFFFGKNYKYSNAPGNFTNFPISFDEIEFVFPRFTYGSIGAVFNDWGVNLNIGKEGLSIGNTKTGSIIYNKSFETDAFVQLTVFSDYIKYTMEAVEVAPEKFIYWHQIDVKIFDKIKLGAMEGALINESFELRFFNPLMVFHSYSFWKNFSNETEDHYYNESHCCSYLGLTFEVNPIQYLRIYGLYAMNEIQLPNEWARRWLSYPDSLGGQLGAELKLPSDFGGYWDSGLEVIYCSPFLYVKQAPDWSLYRSREDMITWEDVNSWIGSPFGPDTFAVNVSFGYEQTGKWSAGFNYLFKIHGENDFSLFDKKWYDKDKGVWKYYPYVKYVYADDNGNSKGMDDAVEEGRNMWMSGCQEYKHQFGINGSYNITSKIKVQGEFIYSFVFNAKNISGNFQHGMQAAIGCAYQLF